MRCTCPISLALTPYHFELVYSPVGILQSNKHAGLALINLCQRVELRELRFFATAVIIQRETGGNLTDILEKIASLVRERFKLRNQIKALTAEGRLSGWILILMPPVLFLIMLKINPDYTLLLINHDLGRMMALTALTMQMMGMLAIRKIVNIKV